MDPVEGGIAVNIGDMLSRWSNDSLLSNLHRVRMPTPEEARPPRPRYSMAFFMQAGSSSFSSASCVLTNPSPSFVNPLRAGRQARAHRVAPRRDHRRRLHPGPHPIQLRQEGVRRRGERQRSPASPQSAVRPVRASLQRLDVLCVCVVWVLAWVWVPRALPTWLCDLYHVVCVHRVPRDDRREIM